MVIHLQQGDPWCYCFNNPDIHQDNVEKIIASDEVVFIDNVMVTGKKRELMLTIAALDTLLAKYSKGRVIDSINLYHNGRREVKKFLSYYLYQQEHIWEVAVHLGTSSEEEAMKWLLDISWEQ